MIIDNYQSFLQELLTKIKEKGINVSELELDHIGYQASSDSDYDHLIPECEKLGTRVHEAIVRGRRVSIFKLNEPLRYKHHVISALEIYAPVKDQVCQSALEHAEFVLTQSFEEFVKQYPKLAWDTTAINQPGFPMLKLRLTPSMQVKFHPEPILKTVSKK